MNPAPLVVFALAAAGAAIAGPYDRPWSVVATDRAASADPLLRPVIVNRVDGVNSMNNESVVAPGPHQVTVDLPPRKGFRQATQVTFDLATEPCTRYFVAAKLETQVAQQWVPVVRGSEPIGECRAKFGLAQAPK